MQRDLFDLSGKTAIVTGAAGLLGPKHAEALLECGASVILADCNSSLLEKTFETLREVYGERVKSELMDVTSKQSVQSVFSKHKIDILINNAAKDPKVKNTDQDESNTPASRFETMSEEFWEDGINVIMKGTFLCSQSFSNEVLNRKGSGVIVNISSDLGVISPDHRLYRKEGIPEDMQNVKPITYSAAKWAVIGMTKYLAVYFAERNIRVNCLSPAGIYNNHPEDFVEKISNVIPMKRMGNLDELKGAIMFLSSDASSYMTGHNLLVDGGRTVW